MHQITITLKTKITMYDFYYSAKHEAHMKSMSLALIGCDSYQDAFINGKKYTEMITAGCTPATASFDDIMFVGTYDGNGITFSSPGD